MQEDVQYPTDVLIVGAGMAGLAAATALQRTCRRGPFGMLLRVHGQSGIRDRSLRGSPWTEGLW